MAGNTENAAVWGGADVLIGGPAAIIPDGNDLFPLRRTAKVATATSTALTSSVDVFLPSDVGQSISGPGIPAGATITAVANSKAATLSAAATAAGSNVDVTIGAVTGWRFVGLLDGGQGFTEGIEVQSQDHSAWGYGVIATTFQGQKVTKTFTALEENETVMGLVYDVSGATFTDSGYEGDLKTKDYTERVKIAFVTTSGATERRLISKSHATISPTNAGTESETSLASKQFTATIVPANDKTLWYAYKGPVV